MHVTDHGAADNEESSQRRMENYASQQPLLFYGPPTILKAVQVINPNESPTTNSCSIRSPDDE